VVLALAALGLFIWALETGSESQPAWLVGIATISATVPAVT
jgi:hypothetical protein